MLTNEFIRHVYRVARVLWKDRYADPRFPEGMYSTMRDAIESAFDAVNEYWQ